MNLVNKILKESEENLFNPKDSEEKNLFKPRRLNRPVPKYVKYYIGLENMYGNPVGTVDIEIPYNLVKDKTDNEIENIVVDFAEKNGELDLKDSLLNVTSVTDELY